MKKIILAIIALVGISTLAFAKNPKLEFRGAWMHTVHQSQFGHSTDSVKAYMISELDKLKAAGVNAVIFQVRPSADAFYPSELEPWSRFLTKYGAAPKPYWDPLQFMIDQAHARGMELHAWLNPYRVTTSKNEVLPTKHIYYQHKDWFVRYDDKLYFDPGLPQSREFITKVVADIITRYDVDGIHFDDYFYPYPVDGKDFPDDKSYARYGRGMDRGDWRRKNVDQLIQGLHRLISSKKPWVVFGISPFGIWRNKASDVRGSDTNGLQNYDALYADVLLWAEKGWIDYLLPQLYWELEHPRASYLVLVQWWNDNACGRHMFIGQDTHKTMTKPDLAPSTEPNQLRHKIELTRQLPNIGGNCWWPSTAVTRNVGGVADALADEFQSTIALWPEYPWISKEEPAGVMNLADEGGTLTWEAPQKKGTADDAVKFVVYRFDKEADLNINDVNAIQAVTWGTEYEVSKPGVYYVTSLSRVNNESAPAGPIVIK